MRNDNYSPCDDNDEHNDHCDHDEEDYHQPGPSEYDVFNNNSQGSRQKKTLSIDPLPPYGQPDCKTSLMMMMIVMMMVEIINDDDDDADADILGRCCCSCFPPPFYHRSTKSDRSWGVEPLYSNYHLKNILY